MPTNPARFIYLGAFILCIPIANWMIGNVGTFCVPNGPCTIPVVPGLAAPSGVLMIGLALVLRDLVQRSLVFASAAAFLLSELADLAIYTPLQRRSLVIAVFASSIVGLVIDSALFLYLAFGSLDFIACQIVGKAWMVLAALPVIHFLSKREAGA